MQTYSYNGRTLRDSQTVETTDEKFLNIKVILEDPSMVDIFLKGFRFRHVFQTLRDLGVKILGLPLPKVAVVGD